MRQKLFRKYILAIGAVVLLCLTVIMIILTFFYNRYLAEEKYSLLNRACESISKFVTDAPKDDKLNSPDRGLYYVMNNVSAVSGLDTFITDSEGVIKSCVCAEKRDTGRCNHIGQKISKEYIKTAINGKSDVLTTAGIYKTVRYVSAQKLVVDGTQRGFIIATAPATATLNLITKIAKLYLLSAVVPVVLLFIALYLLTYRVTRPLNLMSEAAKSMAKGNFSKRIPVTSDDEIGELAMSFNQMTNSLSRLEESRKDFIANVSHELKTPMTTIGGFIDGMIDGTIEPEKQPYYLGLVSEEIKRLSRMVQSMLSISRLESKEFVLKPEKFDFREMLLGIVISQEKRIEECEYRIGGLDEIPDVIINADKDMIYRVVYNLVDNAVKFTNKGGKIDFLLRVDSKKMIFRIENTGIGIKANDIPYVFERFYKGDKSRSAVKNSTGLGLYIVKTIVKNHGGTITVSSVENKYTAFEVTLPL